jgi:hypothetical protein
MYRVALHLGNLLHSHPLAHRPFDLVGSLKRFIPTSMLSRWGPQQPARDERAEPEVCAALKREESGSESETDPLALTSDEDDDEGRWGMDETWLSLP